MSNPFHQLPRLTSEILPSITAVSPSTSVIETTETIIPFEEATTIPAIGITVVNNVFTFVQGGVYEGSLSLNITATLSAVLHVWLERERGGVWSVIPNTLSTISKVSDSSVASSLTGVILFEAGDKLRVKCSKMNAGNLSFIGSTLVTTLGTVGSLPAVLSIKKRN